MTLDDLISVSGLPGLYKLVANRTNGLVVADLDTDKKRFCSIRKHQFTPLGSVAIYTHGDAVPMKDIFSRMEKLGEEEEMPSSKASKELLFQYFKKVLPDFDQEKVYQSDIKKVIKWFQFLKEKEILDLLLAETESGDEEE